jgi:hypothetical protein
MNGGYRDTSDGGQRALERFIATWDFIGQRPDELTLSKVS